MSDREMRLECLRLALKDGPNPEAAALAAKFWGFICQGGSHEGHKSRPHEHSGTQPA
jgi:hypothetical protein